MSPVASVPLWARDAASNIQQAPQTFSNWDKCMAKDYCKYAGSLLSRIAVLITSGGPSSSVSSLARSSSSPLSPA